MAKILRGSLVTPFELGDESIGITGREIVNTLKASLLYWDKTCIGIPTRAWTDDTVMAADALKRLGAAEEFELEATRFGFSGDPLSINSIRAELNSKFTGLRKRRGEIWSFLPTSPENDFRKNYQNYRDDPVPQMRKLIELALYKGLPMPDREVAFEDILEFKFGKKDRNTELRTLHDSIDDIAGLFASEEDSEEAVLKAMSRLDDAISSVEKVYMERWKISRKSLLKAAFVATSAGAGAVAGNYLDALAHMPALANGALGAAVTTLTAHFAVSEPQASPALGLAYALDVRRM